MKHMRLCLLIVLIAVLLSACQKASQIPASYANTPGVCISISSSTCPGVTVNLGEQVSWTNQDDADHILKVVNPDGQVLYSTNLLQPGDSASFSFAEQETYPYTCSSDEMNTGTITVQP